MNCDVGKYASIGDTSCSQCLAASTPPPSVCSYCEPEHSPTGCRPVPLVPGQGSSNGASVCTDCVAGKYDDGNNLCQPCDAGSFSAAGASSCDSSCPAGTYGRMGETTCSDCDAGKYASLGADFVSCVDWDLPPSGLHLAAPVLQERYPAPGLMSARCVTPGSGAAAKRMACARQENTAVTEPDIALHVKLASTAALERRHAA